MQPVRGRWARRRRCDAVALVLAVLLGACDPGAPAPPDVVLVTLDTTRADHLGIYGYERDTSPALDRLAAEGVVYRRAWSTAPWTLPAHASLLTGKHPTSHGAHWVSDGGDAELREAVPRAKPGRFRVNRLGDEEHTLAELLAERGYATAAFAAGPWLAPAFGLLQGYGVQNAEAADFAGRPADALTDAAIDWLRSVPEGRPIHLLINYFDPHWPYEPPAEFAAASRRWIDRYDGEIRFMDHHIGRLLAALREAGRYDGALIVAVGDHGELFGEHGAFFHDHWLYEPLLRVPLIVRFPGARRAGEHSDSAISLVDLLPLVAGELDLALPPGVEGRLPGERELMLAESYRNPAFPVVRGADVDRDVVAAVRWPRKLIANDRGERQLYRLDEDPGEERERSGEASEGAHAARLAAELRAARAAFTPPDRSAPPEGVDPALQERLRALGYALGSDLPERVPSEDPSP